MRKLIIGAVVVGSLTCARAATAGDSANERASLTGLSMLSVVVEDVSSTASTNGITTAALQMDAERRLRQAGITLIADADAYVYVRVTVADPGASLPLPYYIEVALIQEIKLPRTIQTRTPLQSPTWSVNRLGLIGADRLRANVTDQVGGLVDQFVRAFRAVNPR